jgi:hypothetical protein
MASNRGCHAMQRETGNQDSTFPPYLTALWLIIWIRLRDPRRFDDPNLRRGLRRDLEHAMLPDFMPQPPEPLTGDFMSQPPDPLTALRARRKICPTEDEAWRKVLEDLQHGRIVGGQSDPVSGEFTAFPTSRWAAVRELSLDETGALEALPEIGQPTRLPSILFPSDLVLARWPGGGAASVSAVVPGKPTTEIGADSGPLQAAAAPRAASDTDLDNCIRDSAVGSKDGKTSGRQLREDAPPWFAAHGITPVTQEDLSRRLNDNNATLRRTTGKRRG